jgi:Siphovirus ReqiPepy6 Gp37-like protein
MYVYVLDDLLRRTAVIDRFNSMIWTERWRDKGDFELVVNSTPAMRSLIKTGNQLAITESDRVMEIKYVEDAHDSEGNKILKATGPSLEATLEDRVATDGMVGLGEEDGWVINGTPGNVARYIFDQICRLGLLSTSDIIPFIQPGNLYPAGSIDEHATLYEITVPINSVFGAVKDLCDQYELGFRLVRNQDKSQLFFEIYSGDNRTTQQSTLMPVVFSPELENMKNTTEVNSIVDYKNVAYVFGKNGSEIVYSDTASAETAGFERRVMFVDAKDVDEPAGPTLTSILRNKGLDALAKQRPITAFDGEVDQYTKYKYNLHYRLGDLVEMRNSDGATNHMRVTEQIFVCDGEGDRAYPTLAVESYIMPGTWSSWGNDTWAGGGEEVWAEDE